MGGPRGGPRPPARSEPASRPPGPCAPRDVSGEGAPRAPGSGKRRRRRPEPRPALPTCDRAGVSLGRAGGLPCGRELPAGGGRGVGGGHAGLGAPCQPLAPSQSALVRSRGAA